MDPLISIIVPAHNSAATIGTAIQSMLGQTYVNTEIVVVDDGSTDATPEVVQALAQAHPRVSYHRLPYDDPHRFNKRGRNINAGYMARNYGFTKIRGEWVTFQDADDASLRNRLEVQYRLACEYDALHVCVQWQQYRDDLLGKALDVDRIFAEKAGVFVPADQITTLARQTKGPVIALLGRLNARIPFEVKTARVVNRLFFRSLASYPASGNSPLFRSEILERVRFRALPERVWPSFTGRGADRDFNFQVAETYGRSIAFNLPLYLYRVARQNEPFVSYEPYLIP